MPKVQHEILHQFLRDCPEILRRLLPGSLGIVWNDSTQVAVASVDFTDATPTEYRADSCVIVNGPPKSALVLEAQLNIAPEKPTQWLKYAAAVRHTHGCDAYVVVLTLKPEVERWARKPVVLNNSCTFWPVVIGPSVLGPRGFADIEELPALSVLTVMASAGSPDYERIVVRGIKRLIRLANRKNARLARAQARLYIDLIMSGLSPARQQYLKEKMENERPKYYSWAFNQSYDDGVAKGKAEGIAEANIENSRANLEMLLTARGLILNKSQAKRISRTVDLVVLKQWMVRAATATSVDDVFLDG